MRRASSGKRSPTSSVELSTWRTARSHCDCSVTISVDWACCSAAAAWRARLSRDAFGSRTAAVSPHSGQATMPRSCCETKSSSEANQPSYACCLPQRRLKTFMAALSSRRGDVAPLQRPAAGVPVGEPEQADERLRVGDLAAPRRLVELVDRERKDVEELAGVEPSLAGHEAAREPDLDAFGRIADRVVQDSRARPLARAVAGLLGELADGAVERRLA